MPLFIKRSPGFAVWTAFALSWIGCAGTPDSIESPSQRDDLGGALETQPITEESINETQMIFRRAEAELRALAVIPTGFFHSNNFEPGGGVGLRFGIEVSKDLFASFTAEWARINQGKGIPSAPASLASVKSDQFYDYFDRYNFLIGLDKDLLIAKSFLKEKSPLRWRIGAGVGLTVVDGEVDSFLKDQLAKAGTSVKLVPYVGFLARIGTSVRWEFAKDWNLYAEADYDFISPFTIEVKSNGSRFRVEDDIDFGSINLGVGLTYSF